MTYLAIILIIAFAINLFHDFKTAHKAGTWFRLKDNHISDMRCEKEELIRICDDISNGDLGSRSWHVVKYHHFEPSGELKQDWTLACALPEYYEVVTDPTVMTVLEGAYTKRVSKQVNQRNTMRKTALKRFVL